MIDVHMAGKADIWVDGSDEWTALHIRDEYNSLVWRATIFQLPPEEGLSALLAALKCTVPSVLMDAKSLSWQESRCGLRVSGRAKGENLPLLPTELPSGTKWIEVWSGFTLFVSAVSEVRVHIGGVV